MVTPFLDAQKCVQYDWKSLLDLYTACSIAEGSPMSSMGKETLKLWIADFKFSHNFVICDKLPEADFLFGIDLQKWYSLSYCWDSDRHLFIQREASFLTYTRNKEDLHNIALVKSTLKIPPGHNTAVPIKFRGHNLQDQVSYFISNQHTKKGIDPNIHILNGIYSIKGRLTLHVMVANYTNKHITFNKEQCIGHMEPTIDWMPQKAKNSVTTQRMVDDQVQPDTFTPPLHCLPLKLQCSLDQFIGLLQNTICKWWNEHWHDRFDKNQTDTGTSDKNEIKKKVSKWYIVVILVDQPPSQWYQKAMVVKNLVFDYTALHKVTRKFIWPMPKVEDIYLEVKWCKIFLYFGPASWIPSHTSQWCLNP